MATKLKDLKITGTDLVTQGANPDAHIRLFKRKDTREDGEQANDSLVQKLAAAIAGVFGRTTGGAVAKVAETFSDELEEKKLQRICGQAWDYAYALNDSLCSIITDKEMTEEAKRDTMFTSLDEFAETMRSAIPNWARGEYAEGTEPVQKSEAQNATFAGLWKKYAAPAQENGDNNADPTITESEPGNSGDANTKKSIQKEETANMKFEKSKMTPEEQAILAEFEKKFGIEESDAGTPAPNTGTPETDGGITKSADKPANGTESGDAPLELHPEVKKALADNQKLTAEIEGLKKNLEIKDLAAVAKKYEIIGKKTDELAPKLYELKKAGGTAYDDFVGLLDEQVTLVEKSGLYGELGSNAAGSPMNNDEIGIKAAEIKKSNANMTAAEAIAKAFEENPELAAKYEKDYMGGKR